MDTARTFSITKRRELLDSAQYKSIDGMEALLIDALGNANGIPEKIDCEMVLPQATHHKIHAWILSSTPPDKIVRLIEFNPQLYGHYNKAHQRHLAEPQSPRLTAQFVSLGRALASQLRLLDDGIRVVVRAIPVDTGFVHALNFEPTRHLNPALPVKILLPGDNCTPTLYTDYARQVCSRGESLVILDYIENLSSTLTLPEWTEKKPSDVDGTLEKHHALSVEAVDALLNELGCEMFTFVSHSAGFFQWQDWMKSHADDPNILERLKGIESFADAWAPHPFNSAMIQLSGNAIMRNDQIPLGLLQLFMRDLTTAAAMKNHLLGNPVPGWYNLASLDEIDLSTSAALAKPVPYHMTLSSQDKFVDPYLSVIRASLAHGITFSDIRITIILEGKDTEESYAKKLQQCLDKNAEGKNLQIVHNSNNTLSLFKMDPPVSIATVTLEKSDSKRTFGHMAILR